MGRDKATIVFQGRPLWQRQLQVLRDLSPEKIFVSARKAPSWLPFDTELLLDEPPFRGPLSGLTRALASIQTSHLAVLAVDMPFMTSKQMQVLWSLARPGCGVLPMIGDTGGTTCRDFSAGGSRAIRLLRSRATIFRCNG